MTNTPTEALAAINVGVINDKGVSGSSNYVGGICEGSKKPAHLHAY